MKELIDELISLNIIIKVEGCDLKVEGGKEHITPGIVDKIRQNKEALVDYLNTIRDNLEDMESIPIVGEQKDYTLSSSQQGLWLAHHRSEPSKGIFNVFGTYNFEGVLNRSQLNASFQVLIERHESLRTVFRKNASGEVRQVVLQASQVFSNIAYHDLRNIEYKDETVISLLDKHTNASFNLEDGPLLNILLLQIEDQSFIFSTAMHHIISDEWSLKVMVKELAIIYNASVKNEIIPLLPLPIQYKDYAAWQRSKYGTKEWGIHQLYWSEQLAGNLPVLDLPLDHPRPRQRSGRGRTVSGYVASSQVKTFKHLLYDQGATLFMGLVSVVNTLLYRYTGEEDILLGTPVADREHPNLADQVGIYVNMLVLRTFINGNESFYQLLNRVKKICLEAYEHQIFPFDELVNILKGNYDPSRNALFDVAITLHNTEIESRKLPEHLEGVHVTDYLRQESTVSKFDLTFDFVEREEELLFTLEYNSDIFEERRISRLAGHLQTILEKVAKSPELPLYKIDYLTTDERFDLLYRFNNTHRHYPIGKHPIKVLDEITVCHGARVAVIDSHRSITYEELSRQSEALAAYLLKEKQLQKGDCVAVAFDKSVEVIVLINAIFKAGLVYVPVNPTDPTPRIEHILRDSNAKMIFCDPKYKERMPTSYRGIYVSVIPDLTLLPEVPIAERGDLEATAYIIYTSGTTGLPKGVMVPYSGIVNISFDHRDRLPVTPEDRVLQFMSLSFDGSILDIYMTLLSGAALVMPSQEILSDVDTFANFLTNTNTTIATLPPSYMRFLNGKQLDSIRVLISAGDVFDVNVCRHYKDKKLFNGYGPTEMTVNTTLYQLSEDDVDISNSIPIGSPAANKKVVILDEQLQLLPLGVQGEICIWGNGMAIGYLHNEELTAQKFIGNPFETGDRLYRSGDIGEWRDDGVLVYKGRKDNQVKVRGYRIEAGEIENILNRHPVVDKSVVIDRKNLDGEKELIAYYVPNLTAGFTIRQELSLPKDTLVIELEDGFTMVADNQSELQLLHKEIVVNNVYLKHGIYLPKNACIVDIGANVGMFSVYAGLITDNAKIYAFEPIPPTFELLKLNTSLYDIDVDIFNFGLGARNEQAVFNYYKYASGLSGRYADESNIHKTVREYISNLDQYNNSFISEEKLESLLKERLIHSEYQCDVKTLSEVIRLNGIKKIDLLKIDVEQAEFDILKGIKNEDWRKIGQVVVEVHDLDNRLNHVRSLMQKHGFRVIVEQVKDLANTCLYNLYAVAEWYPTIEISETSLPLLYSKKKLEVDFPVYLKQHIPEYMVPAYFEAVDDLPLVNGKIDKKTLAMTKQLIKKADYEAPKTDVEKVLVIIWADVLNKNITTIGIKDNFFRLGGHSLNAMRLLIKVHEQFNADIDLSSFFNNPTIESLALEINSILWLNQPEQTTNSSRRMTI